MVVKEKGRRKHINKLVIHYFLSTFYILKVQDIREYDRKVHKNIIYYTTDDEEEIKQSFFNKGSAKNNYDQNNQAIQMKNNNNNIPKTKGEILIKNEKMESNLFKNNKTTNNNYNEQQLISELELLKSAFHSEKIKLFNF